MNLFFSHKISSYLTGIVIAAAVGSSVTSCIPGEQPDNGGGSTPGNTVEPKPDPEGALQMVLYSDSGDNIAGLGFSQDGYIKSLSPSIDWYIASVGDVPGLGNVDYIPMDGWELAVVPRVSMGFVAYSPTQGFARFYVAGMAVDPYDQKPVGVGLMYLGNFTGSDKAIELDKTTYKFPADGGSITAKVQGKEYVPFQFGFTAPWLDVYLASTIYTFITDLIEIKAEPNPTAEERTAELVLTTSAGKVTHISIVQVANPNASTKE